MTDKPTRPAQGQGMDLKQTIDNLECYKMKLEHEKDEEECEELRDIYDSVNQTIRILKANVPEKLRGILENKSDPHSNTTPWKGPDWLTPYGVDEIVKLLADLERK